MQQHLQQVLSPPTRVVWIEIERYTAFTGIRQLSPPTRVVWIEISYSTYLERKEAKSPPTRVVWIEIEAKMIISETLLSPPTRVVWIEIGAARGILFTSIGHHPHGWCGLKSSRNFGNVCRVNVTTHTGGVD